MKFLMKTRPKKRIKKTIFCSMYVCVCCVCLYPDHRVNLVLCPLFMFFLFFLTLATFCQFDMVFLFLSYAHLSRSFSLRVCVRVCIWQ